MKLMKFPAVTAPATVDAVLGTLPPHCLAKAVPDVVIPLPLIKPVTLTFELATATGETLAVIVVVEISQAAKFTGASVITIFALEGVTVNEPDVALMVYVPGPVNCTAPNVTTPATADALVVPAKVAEPLMIVLVNEIVPVYSTSTVLSARCACTVNEVRLFETKPVVGGATLNTNFDAAAFVVIEVAVV